VTYALTEPMPMRVRPQFPAPGVIEFLTFEWRTPADARSPIKAVGADDPEPGRDGTLGLVAVSARPGAAPPDAHAARAEVSVRVTGRQTLDMVAIGDDVRGRPGATVTAEVGVRNLGPAFARGAAEHAALVLMTAPAGTTVVSHPDGCVLANRRKQSYLCVTGADPFEPGDTFTWPFRLRIDRAGELTGSVAVRASEDEPQLTNNVARIVVNPASGSGGAAGPGLPVTGPPVGPLVATGLIFVLAGAVMCRAGRTRDPA
jgi:hypothetical protein